ncbi:MAG: methionyl-tRNA formyltransferase [Chloroflexota bacterium]|nr:methionyl-tRNA formyltransferase [Chloroflexota bacterium]
MDSPRTVFLGTPAAALPTLRALEALGWPVVGVYTAPDRPSGRGRAVEQSPVKRYALERGYTVYAPDAAHSPETTESLRMLRPDLLVLAAYGKILPDEFLRVAPLGALNVHPSLLPRHRGATPVQETILVGDGEAGATLFVMDEGIDTGPIVAQRTVRLRGDERAPALTTRLFELGAELAFEALPAYVRGEIAPRAQGPGDPPLRRITKEAGVIDWRRSAAAIERQTRAYDPWPGTSTWWRGRKLDVQEARALSGSAPPGAVAAHGAGAAVGTGEGLLLPLRVKLEGRASVSVEEFVRGHREFVGARLPS